jgi:hypothetical protein
MDVVLHLLPFISSNGVILKDGLFYFFIYEVVSESSRTVIVGTASVKEDERRGQGHTSASLLHQSAT